MKTKKLTLSALDRSGIPVKKDTKTFEICLDHEPTLHELQLIQNEAGQWQNLHIVKLYPAALNPQKQYNGKFWTISFEVHKDDWLFWCGFCAGKKWGIQSQVADNHKKQRIKEIGEWAIQI